MARIAIGLALATATAVLLPSCAATQNVRALRAYAHEQASMVVAIDRVEDLARSLELVDRLLTGVSYSPGAPWVKRLPLRDADARELRASIRSDKPYDDPEYEVPVVKLYRVHLERILDKYGPEPEKAEFPSILVALASLGDKAALLRTHWDSYKSATATLASAVEEQSKLEKQIAAQHPQNPGEKPPELVLAEKKVSDAMGAADRARAGIEVDALQLKIAAGTVDTEKSQIARDAVTVLSVAWRIELEALALLPIVVVQTVRSLASGNADPNAASAGKLARQTWALPGYVAGIRERLSREAAVLEVMTKALADACELEIGASPGFLLQESAVDQIVGIGLDSIRVDVDAGGSVFFYSALTSQEKSSSNDGKTTYDYTGRRYRLAYQVQPIVLAQAHASLALDWIQLPAAASASFGYATDRVYRSGGTVEGSTLAAQLGVQGTASDVLELGLGLLGVRSSAKIATFNTGTVRQIDVPTGATVSEAPLELRYTQADVGYDVLFALPNAELKAYTEELVVGARYLDYKLPRILYDMTNAAPPGSASDVRNWVYARESPAQVVESKYYMGGFVTRFGMGEAPRWSPFVDLGMYFGAGPATYYFAIDSTRPDSADNRVRHTGTATVFNGALGVGLRWRLLPRTSRVRIDLRALYRADFVYSNVEDVPSADGKQHQIELGAMDVFHGPALSLTGAL